MNAGRFSATNQSDQPPNWHSSQPMSDGDISPGVPGLAWWWRAGWHSAIIKSMRKYFLRTPAGLSHGFTGEVLARSLSVCMSRPDCLHLMIHLIDATKKHKNFSLRGEEKIRNKSDSGWAASLEPVHQSSFIVCVKTLPITSIKPEIS